ncbi:MAG TPA: hypothetical protein VJR89_03955 [Polyangiales bacterium]|nr:hypothetical protein [Polyangiales bacterium]
MLTAGARAAGTPARTAGAGTTAGTGVTPGVGVGTAGTPASACPTLRPSEDAACRVHAEICTYDEIECRCPTGTWSCAEPVDPNCPATMPMHGTVCSVPEATECEFLQDECECTAGRWSCELWEDAGTPGQPVTPPPTPADAGVSTNPAAGAVKCPDLRPVEGLTCTPGRGGCMYDTTQCVCPEGKWLCNERVDPRCPIEPPSPGSMCMGNTDCDYFDIECECLRGTWSCKGND